jgi:catechol 2,3-dioxygenase-like lactoylglutathione lyase family enzyme
VVVDGANDAGGRVVLFRIGGVPRYVISEDKPPGVGAHVAFRADTRDHVHAFHTAVLAAGGRDNDAPGPRPNYYAALVLGPDGMNVEAVCRAAEKPI